MERKKLILIAVAAVILCAGVVTCLAIFPWGPAPAVPAQQEQSDCDKEDRASRDVQDCGIGVLLEPRPTTKGPVKPATPKPKASRR